MAVTILSQYIFLSQEAHTKTSVGLLLCGETEEKHGNKESNKEDTERHSDVQGTKVHRTGTEREACLLDGRTDSLLGKS